MVIATHLNSYRLPQYPNVPQGKVFHFLSEISPRRHNMNGHALLDQTIEHVTAPLDDIVLAAQAGSATAFAELYSTYSRRLFQTILSITRNPHDAEEALQETFLRAYVAIKTFESKSQIYTWLTRIAVNTALMVLRKQHVRSEVLFDPQPDDRCETITFEVKDPAPNPEELCVRHQCQLRLCVRSVAFVRFCGSQSGCE